MRHSESNKKPDIEILETSLIPTKTFNVKDISRTLMLIFMLHWEYYMFSRRLSSMRRSEDNKKPDTEDFKTSLR